MPDEVPPQLVIALQRIGGDDIALTGAKAANLARMMCAGMRVPRGFCITAAAYRQFMASKGGAMPAEIETHIIRAWRNLGEDKLYAVRSSATAEDSAGASSPDNTTRS